MQTGAGTQILALAQVLPILCSTMSEKGGDAAVYGVPINELVALYSGLEQVGPYAFANVIWGGGGIGLEPCAPQPTGSRKSFTLELQ